MLTNKVYPIIILIRDSNALTHKIIISTQLPKKFIIELSQVIQ